MLGWALAANFVDAWARGIVAAVGKRSARRIVVRYTAIADDPRVTVPGRNIARQPANVGTRFS